MLAVVDTGPFYAVVNQDDADHGRCRAVLEQADLRLIIPTMVTAEAAYLVGTRLGSRVKAQLSHPGGEPTPVTTVDATRGELGHGYPQLLRDGQRFLYFVQSTQPDVQGVYVSSPDQPSNRQLIVRTDAKAVYAGAAAPAVGLQTQPDPGADHHTLAA